MFSNEGCALDEDTLEYSWLVEVQLGKLSGKLTLPQLFNVAVGLETLALLAVDPENCLKSPKTVRNCHHGVPSNQCPHTKEENKYKCPSAEDIKYKMTRVSVDAVDVYLIESGTALHTWVRTEFITQLLYRILNKIQDQSFISCRSLATCVFNQYKKVMSLCWKCRKFTDYCQERKTITFKGTSAVLMKLCKVLKENRTATR